MTRIESLARACATYDIDFCPLDEALIDHSSLPVPNEDDAIYNCARGAITLEHAMLYRQTKSVYRDFPASGVNQNSCLWCIFLEHHVASVPRTIWSVTRDRGLLRKYVDQLGGFPIVIKTFGGTRGVGVIQVSGWPSLFSMCDLLVAKSIDFALREFIPSESCERLVVLGNSVIACSTRPNAVDDFRSDGTDPRGGPMVHSCEIQTLAIQATHAVNFNFAGVDVIVDKRDNKPYILEVNCPLDLVATSRITGVNVAERLIRWFFAEN